MYRKQCRNALGKPGVSVTQLNRAQILQRKKIWIMQRRGDAIQDQAVTSEDSDNSDEAPPANQGAIERASSSATEEGGYQELDAEMDSQPQLSQDQTLDNLEMGSLHETFSPQGLQSPKTPIQAPSPPSHTPSRQILHQETPSRSSLEMHRTSLTSRLTFPTEMHGTSSTSRPTFLCPRVNLPAPLSSTSLQLPQMEQSGMAERTSLPAASLYQTPTPGGLKSPVAHPSSASPPRRMHQNSPQGAESSFLSGAGSSMGGSKWEETWKYPVFPNDPSVDLSGGQTVTALNAERIPGVSIPGKDRLFDPENQVWDRETWTDNIIGLVRFWNNAEAPGKKITPSGWKWDNGRYIRTSEG